MIRFEFDMSEEEAHVLLELVSSSVVDAKMNAMEGSNVWNAAERAWWAQHALFLAAMRAKMQHRIVP